MTPRLFCFALLFLAACAPAASAQAPQGAVAETSPRPTKQAPDREATAGAVDLQIAALQATSQANSLAATAAVQAAANATQGVATQRAWDVAGWTATAADVQATATERARGTATAAYAPFVSATRVKLAAEVAAEQDRAAWEANMAPWRARLRAFLPLGVFAAMAYLVGSIARYIFALAEDRRRQWTLTADGFEDDDDPLTISTTPRFVYEGNHGERVELGLDDAQLTTLAHALYRGIPFAERHFTARSVPNFRAVQDAAIAAGLAAWRHPGEPRQGCYLTERGERFFFGQVLGLTPSPTGQSAIAPAWAHAGEREGHA